MSEQTSSRSVGRYVVAAIPLVLFLALALIFFKQLNSGNDPNKLPSVLINKVAPDFPTEPLSGLKNDGVQLPSISRELISGRVVLVNVWASWCVPCRAEHPILTQLAEIRKDLLMVGINYKDKTENARRFLGALGNPFDAVGVDKAGRTSIDWGVYGVPETFVVDGQGVIRLKHVGPLTPRAVSESLMPAIRAAAAGG